MDVSEDVPFRVNVLYGRVEMDTGFRVDPNNPDRLIAWGLSRTYDEHGNLTREQYDENGSIENIVPGVIQPKEPLLSPALIAQHMIERSDEFLRRSKQEFLAMPEPEEHGVHIFPPQTWRDEIRRHVPALKAAGLFCLFAYAGIITLAWLAK